MLKLCLLLLASAALFDGSSAYHNRWRWFDDDVGAVQPMYRWGRDDGFGGLLQTMNDMHRGWMRGFACEKGDKFTVEMDVREFTPEEVTVGISGRTVTITAEHIATPPPSTTPSESVDPTASTTAAPLQPLDITRQMMRSYTVADNVNLDEATARIINGRLIFEAPLIKPPKEETEQKDPNVIEVEINRDK